MLWGVVIDGKFMKTPFKIFTLEEAHALIPQLEILLGELDGKKQLCERLHDMLLMDELLKEAESSKGKAGPSDPLENEARRLDGSVVEIQTEIEKIRSLGCIPRSLERGWIDFPAQRDGRVVFFCWRRGEKAIRFYSADSGNGERLPLD